MNREDISEAYGKALDDGFKQKRIADAIGVPDPSLRKFRSYGSLGEERLRALQKWLTQHRYLPDPHASSKVDPADALVRAIAYDLHSVAAHLERPDLSNRDKARRLVEFITEFSDVLGLYVTELEEPEKPVARVADAPHAGNIRKKT